MTAIEIKKKLQDMLNMKSAKLFHKQYILNIELSF